MGGVRLEERLEMVHRGLLRHSFCAELPRLGCLQPPTWSPHSWLSVSSVGWKPGRGDWKDRGGRCVWCCHADMLFPDLCLRKRRKPGAGFQPRDL